MTAAPQPASVAVNLSTVLVAGVMAMMGFLAAEFFDQRAAAVTGIEARIGEDVAEIKTLMRGIDAKVLELQRQQASVAVEVDQLKRRLDRQGDLIRERNLQRME